MKNRKKETPARAAANKKNAKKSMGPISNRGKSAAKKNTSTHGFFAREWC